MPAAAPQGRVPWVVPKRERVLGAPVLDLALDLAQGLELVPVLDLEQAALQLLDVFDGENIPQMSDLNGFE